MKGAPGASRPTQPFSYLPKSFRLEVPYHSLSFLIALMLESTIMLEVLLNSSAIAKKYSKAALDPSVDFKRGATL